MYVGEYRTTKLRGIQISDTSRYVEIKGAHMKQEYVHLKKSCFFFIASWLKLSYLNIDIENIDPKEVEQKHCYKIKTSPQRPLPHVTVHCTLLHCAKFYSFLQSGSTGLWPRLWPWRTSILTRRGNTRATLI